MQVCLLFNMCGVEFVDSLINTGGGIVQTSNARYAMTIMLLLRVLIVMLANGVVVSNTRPIHAMMQMEESSKLVRVEDAIVVEDLATQRVDVYFQLKEEDLEDLEEDLEEEEEDEIFLINSEKIIIKNS